MGGWETAHAAGIYRSARSLVNLDEGFKDLFMKLPTKRTFIYGEESHPDATGTVTPDAPDPVELQENGISISVIPKSRA